MTREEKANKLGQEYFPNESNVWARPNYEAQWVSEACIKMAEWEYKRLVKKAYEWLISSCDQLHNEYGRHLVFANKSDFIESFKKAMEE